jgi:hypothetical protein
MSILWKSGTLQRCSGATAKELRGQNSIADAEQGTGLLFLYPEVESCQCVGEELIAYTQLGIGNQEHDVTDIS